MLMKTLFMLGAIALLSGCCYDANRPPGKPVNPKPVRCGHPWFSLHVSESLVIGAKCGCREKVKPSPDDPSYPHYFLPDGTELKRTLTDKP